MRIASLLPSATEIVCALGARDALVGVSHECDFPSGVERLPHLTRARIAPVRRSGEIDRAVRDVVRDALAVYDIDMEALERAKPDVIVTQDLCDVCAVSLDDVRHAVARLARTEDVRIVSLKPTRLGDVLGDVGRVAEAIGCASEGERLAASLRDRIDAIAARGSAIAGARPSVLAVEWIDPVMIAGMWMPELIALGGGRALVTAPGEHAPTLGREELRALDPDIVLVKPCGFPLERTLEELDTLQRLLPWDAWRATREGRVYCADGNAYFNRPGPRLVESLEIVAAAAHPAALRDLREKHDGAVVRLDRALGRHAFSS
jgi:iron complex transport system substrate-binding protein